MISLRRLRRSDFSYVKALAFKGLSANPLHGFDFDEFTIAKIFDRFYRTRDAFFVGLEEDGRLVGWFSAVPGHGVMHSETKAMSQVYYQCELEGFKGIAALRQVHESFFNYTEAKKYELAITSSILSSQKVFNRILVRDGWTPSTGELLVKPTRFHLSLRQQRGESVGGGGVASPEIRAD